MLFTHLNNLLLSHLMSISKSGLLFDLLQKKKTKKKRSRELVVHALRRPQPFSSFSPSYFPLDLILLVGVKLGRRFVSTEVGTSRGQKKLGRGMLGPISNERLSPHFFFFFKADIVDVLLLNG